MGELAELERYMVHLSEALGHADRHAGLRGYCAGLMSPVARKSVEPMAAALDPQHVRSRHQSLHHFVADSDWCDEALRLRVAQWVVPKMDFSDGGWWVIDDTGFAKQGRHSVGVARQYCGMLGKQDHSRPSRQSLWSRSSICSPRAHRATRCWSMRVTGWTRRFASG